MSKNLTEIVKHPLSKKDVAGYARYDESEWGQHMVTRCPGESTEYLTGPVVDRLHEFEKLGLEPEEIKSLMAAHSDLLKKYGPKKVVVDTEFTQYVHEMHHKVNGCDRYPLVKETRYYRCPSCYYKLAERYKTTKLYPNRTVGTEGIYNQVIHPLNSHCPECGQALDWSDVDKETWS